MTIVAIGDNVTDCYVDLGQMFPGGNCVNVAVHAARAGSSAAYIGVVGDDSRGRLVATSLEQEGVDTARVRVQAGPTAYAVVRLVDGERVFGPNDKGVSLFEPTDEDVAYASRFEVAHSSYCSGFEAFLPTLASVTRVSFDFNDRTHDGYADPLLPHVWAAQFSASHLSERETEELVVRARGLGAHYVFATLGPRGAVMYDGAKIRHVPATTGNIMDTLGAGDAFTGRALHGLLVGEPPDELLAGAATAAERACRFLGGYGHAAPIPRDLLGARGVVAYPLRCV